MDSESLYKERAKWFSNRIGKRVYRNSVSCQCEVCKNVGAHGLVIHDEMHATYLHDIEGCFTAEGRPTRYFDTPEEAKEFEINNPSND